MTNDFFQSPTYGKLRLGEVRQSILSFIEKDPKRRYKIVIGTDSSPSNGTCVDYITALVIHRVGKGGIYFWKRVVKHCNSPRTRKVSSSQIRERVYEEAALSLATADEFLDEVKNDGISKYDVEIHVDIGKFGETRDMIAEVVGMIRGSGFVCKTKPDSYGASKVADRHT